MGKSPAMHWVGMVTWAVTALVSLHVGLTALGFDFSQSGFFMSNPGALMPLKFFIGLCGLISAVMFALSCCGKDCETC